MVRDVTLVAASWISSLSKRSLFTCFRLFCLRKRIRLCISRIVYVARILIPKFSLSMNLITEIFRLTYLSCSSEFQIHHSVPDMDGVVGPIISLSRTQSKRLHIAHHSPRMKRFFVREISFFLLHSLGELNLWIIGEGSFRYCDLTVNSLWLKRHSFKKLRSM